MVIILPAAGQFAAVEQAPAPDLLKAAVAGFRGTQVNLTMPKFKVESSFGLKKALSELGMAVAFSDRADFSGMDGKRDLFIQDVVHKSFVQVDETGTEAAAATGVIVGATSMPAQPITVTVDRPFFFAIRDNKTGTLLFTGRVLNTA
jgi:serpin B